VHLPGLHNFRFQSSFQILFAENFHNFFAIFFRFCLRGLFPPGVKVLWSLPFFTVLFPAVQHFGPVFLLEESDKQQIALHFSYIFSPRFLRFLALSVAAGFSVGDSPHPS
jgi:hypothetical protein